MVTDFNQRSATEQIQNQDRQIDFLNRRNQELLAEMNEVKELVGMAESKDPTDHDRFHLKTIIRNLKQKCDRLVDENEQIGKVVDALK